jgi:hypothetical protein
MFNKKTLLKCRYNTHLGVKTRQNWKNYDNIFKTRYNGTTPRQLTSHLTGKCNMPPYIYIHAYTQTHSHRAIYEVDLIVVSF